MVKLQFSKSYKLLRENLKEYNLDNRKVHIDSKGKVRQNLGEQLRTSHELLMQTIFRCFAKQINQQQKVEKRPLAEIPVFRTSNAALATKMNCTKRNVQLLLRRLEKAGFISTHLSGASDLSYRGTNGGIDIRINENLLFFVLDSNSNEPYFFRTNLKEHCEAIEEGQERENPAYLDDVDKGVFSVENGVKLSNGRVKSRQNISEKVEKRSRKARQKDEKVRGKTITLSEAIQNAGYEVVDEKQNRAKVGKNSSKGRETGVKRLPLKETGNYINEYNNMKSGKADTKASSLDRSKNGSGNTIKQAKFDKAPINKKMLGGAKFDQCKEKLHGQMVCMLFSRLAYLNRVQHNYIDGFLTYALSHAKNPKELMQIFNELSMRIIIASRYVERDPHNRFIPLPSIYLDLKNKDGFTGTKMWYLEQKANKKQQVKLTIQQEQFFKAYTAFNKHASQFLNTPDRETYRKGKAYLSKTHPDLANAFDAMVVSDSQK